MQPIDSQHVLTETYKGVEFSVMFNISSYAWIINGQREGGFYGESSAINAAKRTIRRQLTGTGKR